MAFGTAGMSSIYDDKIITLSNINLEYPGKSGMVTALQNIDLDILRGEFVCLLGPTGCGKSSLLSIIAGIQNPTDGTAVMGGKEIHGSDRNRIIMFQTPTIFHELSVYQNVTFGIRHRCVAADEIPKEAEFYMKLTGVEEFRDNKPYELSEITRYRAALARLLAHKPEIIIMDEPFFNLAPAERENMQNLIRDVWQRTGVTILCVPKDVDEALSLATRIIVMSANPGQIIKEYRTEFTYDICGGNRKGVRRSNEYTEMREEILDMIR